MAARVATTSSISSSSRGSRSIGSGTYEGTNSLTSSVRLRGGDGGEDNSTLDDTGTNSMTSSMNMRDEYSSTGSSASSYANELSLPSSFASSNVSNGDPGGGVGTISGIVSRQSHQPSRDLGSSSRSTHSNLSNSGRMEVYSGQGQVVSGGNSIITSQNDDGTNNGEDQLAVRISKETKPMMHLLRLLKEMDGSDGNQQPGDPHAKALASLIGDFEQEVSQIEHRIKDENLIMNGEQPPLPPNWIALEDPDSGDIYYANEATGETQWERPGLMNELQERLEESNMSNNLEVNNMRPSNMSTFDDQSMQRSIQESLQHSRASLQQSITSNNYEQGSVHSNRSNRSNDFRQESMRGSNMSNNFESSRQSNMNNNRNDFETSHQSNMSNNRKDFETSHQSNMSSGMMSNIDKFQGSHSNMANTLESSLTDSHRSNLSRELPPDWIALEDPDTGETYYANEATGESTWEKPSVPQSLLAEENVDDDDDDDGTLPPDWIALEDADSGDTYYLNQVTMATTWDRPSKGGSSEQRADVAENDENSQQPSENEADDEDSHDEDLPPGWEAILDPSSGDYYYAHESTGETQWEKPEFSEEDNFSNQQSPLEDDNNDELTSDENLPDGWFAAVDEDSGDKYYCNEETGETTWDFPSEPAVDNGSLNNPNQSPVDDEEEEEDDDDDDLPPGWFTVVDPSSGDPYFCNEETGETTWDRPISAGASGNNMARDNSDSHEQNLMSRLSINDNTVYEDDDSVTSSQY